MPKHMVGTGRTLISVAQSEYPQKVLATDPYAYWPLYETEGTVAACLVDPAQNGVYVGTTLAHSTGPDGNPVPYFDGVNDYVNVFTSALDTAFAGLTGTLAIWFRVHSAATWTATPLRYFAIFQEDANNTAYIRKDNSADDTVRYHYRGGGLTAFKYATCSDLGWVHVAMAWDKPTDNKVYYYLNGVELTPASEGILNWVGGLTVALLGASTTTPTFTWHGWLANAALWDTKLSSSVIAGLAVV